MAEESVTAAVSKINFCLKISNVSELDEIWSPEYLVQGIPFQVNICKMECDEDEELAIYLYCRKKNYDEIWSHVAYATFKLLPFNEITHPVVSKLDPYVFDNYSSNFGDGYVIEWENLLDVEEGYIKDDTINMDISIEVADPEDENKSRLTFESIESGCEAGCTKKFRLSLSKIENLMAVRSKTFNMQKLPWILTVFKTRSSNNLSVRLESKIVDKKILLKSKAHVKLISANGDEKSIEVTAYKSFENTDDIFELNVVSWDKLSKPQNGFVNNNSINMEVKIKLRDPENYQSNGASQPKTKNRKLECSICLEAFGDQDISSTKCGHLFCKPCITNSIKANKKCPSCNGAVTANDLHPVYLPFTN